MSTTTSSSTSSTQPQTIAVFGATGQQGGVVTDALLARGASVRALVRNPDSGASQALAARGVELARIDLDQPTTLEQALAGVDAFFFMTTPGGPAGPEGEVTQGQTFIQAATAAKVPFTVFSSVGGAERHSGVPHFETKRRVELALADSGLAHAIVRPVFFMDNFAGMGVSEEDGTLVLRLPFPDGIALQMVAARDIGTVVAAVVTGAVQLPGGTVEIAGDELTGTQIAEVLGAARGLPSRYEELPLQVLDGQDDYQKMFEWFTHLPAYQADFAATRSIAPDTLDLAGWARTQQAG